MSAPRRALVLLVALLACTLAACTAPPENGNRWTEHDGIVRGWEGR